MLNPIDTAAVIRDGGAVGRFPAQIHEGVAWWLGACLVVTRQARRLVVAHNGHPAITEFAHRLCRGATNARHYACTVHYMGHQSEDAFHAGLGELPETPGAWLSGADSDGGVEVHIRLYARQGIALDEAGGLARIRALVDTDCVPIPVNDSEKGSIELWHHPLAQGDRP